MDRLDQKPTAQRMKCDIPSRVRNRLKVMGTVQGVGFRPFVYQLALRHNISGWVSNTSEGVLIEAESDDASIRAFLRDLHDEAPRLAKIADVRVQSIEPLGDGGFFIRESEAEDQRIAMIPVDVAMCPACAADISDPRNRRFGYPFTNCTDCGPRFTIIRGIPYDRPQTTMAAFEMCPECQKEYNDPSDRRFHAQPNACPVCGPRVWLEGAAINDGIDIQRAAEMLKEGRIVAIKGLGGFHLACDARNAEAVRELRQRKGRSRKPFALMVRDLDEARRLCRMSPDEESILLSYERPIVLLEAAEDSGIAPEVAPGSRYLGLMLPYTPLHQLLFQNSPPVLVMTSGNLSEEPITYRNDEALSKLAHISDAFLMHNREIYSPCDDSVVRPILGQSMAIRRARGFVPGPIDLGIETTPILACGGEQKNTFCLTVGRWAVMSQHIGDMDNVETLNYYKQAVDHFTCLFDVQPQAVAYDMHPDYLATRYALSLGCSNKIPVQHHHAHAASCMAENGVNGPVIGVTFDGAGYGIDGAIWGGEFLIADLVSFKRVARLRYVPMPGGSAAIKSPSRMALAYLRDVFGDEAQDLARKFLGFNEEEYRVLVRQIERGINSPITSSMGRLFDSASAILRLCSEATFEGEPAIALEMTADPAETGFYDFETTDEDGCSIIDTRPIFRGLVGDILSGQSTHKIAGKFHNTVVNIIIEVCSSTRNKVGLSEVALSGGCFQNLLLIESSIKRLESMGFIVYRHRLVPPNDGGISLGQAAIAANIMLRERHI